MEQTDWWRTFFDQKYLELYEKDLNERTKAEVDFIIQAVSLTPHTRILDLACGYGRHSIELTKRGFGQVTGLDYSRIFIEKAKRDASNVGVNIEFAEGDMRHISYESEFDVVLMLFTSFGYFSHQENKDVLKQVNKALKPNGKFLLDVVNAERVFDRFKREGQKQGDSNIYKIERLHKMSEVEVVETQILDMSEQLEHTHREWMADGIKKSDDFFLRHYTADQLKQMLAEAGLEFKQLWGDYQGNPQNETNWRTIILSEKVSG